MPETELAFVQATQAHHARVYAIVRERAEWIASTGSRQWSIFLTDVGETFISDVIATGYTYLVTTTDDAGLTHDVGTLRLQWADRRFWGEAGMDGLAGYVHTLAVRCAFAGQNLSARMLDWAGEQVAANGRSLLRIDCAARNTRLIAHYLSMGFEKRGLVSVDLEPDYFAQQLERRARPRGG